MSNTSDKHFVTHAFGRDMAQVEIPTIPLPPSQQQAQMSQPQLPQHGGGLPDDFDHIVRSIGEW